MVKTWIWIPLNTTRQWCCFENHMQMYSRGYGLNTECCHYAVRNNIMVNSQKECWKQHSAWIKAIELCIDLSWCSWRQADKPHVFKACMVFGPDWNANMCGWCYCILAVCEVKMKKIKISVFLLYGSTSFYFTNQYGCQLSGDVLDFHSTIYATPVCYYQMWCNRHYSDAVSVPVCLFLIIEKWQMAVTSS